MGPDSHPYLQLSLALPCLPTSPSRQTELITADAFFQASLASKQPCKQSSGLQCFSSLTFSVCLVNPCSSLSPQVRHPTSLPPFLTSPGLHRMPLPRRSLPLPASTVATAPLSSHTVLQLLVSLGWGYTVSYSPFGFQLCIEHPRGMEKVNVHATLSSLVSAALKWMITCRTWSMLGPRGTRLFSNTPFLQSFPLQILGGHATVQKHSVAF